MKKALLLSGGMDSLALAWWKRPDIAVTLDYGQKAAFAELEASAAICKRLDIEHVVVSVPCHDLGSGDMAGKAISDLAEKSDWWPFRNQLLITLALMKIIDMRVDELQIASVSTDGNHLDGTLPFIQKVDSLSRLQEGHVRVTAPAIHLTTIELIDISGVPMELLAWSHSCHKANVTCGDCRGCNKYFSIYEELNSRSSE
jgi:7-cyano-7-deazaguanine synthase